LRGGRGYHRAVEGERRAERDDRDGGRPAPEGDDRQEVERVLRECAEETRDRVGPARMPKTNRVVGLEQTFDTIRGLLPLHARGRRWGGRPPRGRDEVRGGESEGVRVVQGGGADLLPRQCVHAHERAAM